MSSITTVARSVSIKGPAFFDTNGHGPVTLTADEVAIDGPFSIAEGTRLVVRRVPDASPSLAERLATWLGRFTVVFVAFFLLGAVACTPLQVATAREDFHAASAAALGLLTAAQQNPALVAEAKAAVVAVVTKAAPQDAAQVAQALGHIDAGNLALAAQVVQVSVQASAPGAVVQ